MRKESEEKIFDVRLVQKHIFEGVIQMKDYEKYLSNIPDSSEHMEELILESSEQDSGMGTEIENDNLLDQEEISSDTEITL